MKTTMQAIFTPAGRIAGFSLSFPSPFLLLLLSHFHWGTAICLRFTLPSRSLICILAALGPPPHWIHLCPSLPPLTLIFCFSTYFWIIYRAWNFLSSHFLTYFKRGTIQTTLNTAEEFLFLCTCKLWCTWSRVPDSKKKQLKIFSINTFST